MKNQMIKNAMILTAITLVAGILLGFVYEITKEPIAKAQAQATAEAYQEVFASAESFTEYEGFDADYAKELLTEAGYEDDSIDSVVVASNGTEDLGYVITVTAHDGYGGDITFTIGITNDGMMNGISILSISETAGLGMKATEESFSGQFANKATQVFSVTKTGATSEDEIDAISGATITSSAVSNGVNAGLVYYDSIIGGVSNE